MLHLPLNIFEMSPALRGTFSEKQKFKSEVRRKLPLRRGLDMTEKPRLRRRLLPCPSH